MSALEGMCVANVYACLLIPCNFETNKHVIRGHGTPPSSRHDAENLLSPPHLPAVSFPLDGSHVEDWHTSVT
jgi:hypothetical protein